MSAAQDAALVDLLTELVEIPSVNPALDATGTGEAAVAAAVADWAASCGLHVERVGSDPTRPNVVVSSRLDAGDAPTLLLCGHLDTVGTEGRRIVARRDGDRLHGRGSYDMKAGLVASLEACRQVARRGAATRVVVAAVADEEHASRGMVEVLDHLDTSTIDAAIVTEPTELEVAVAHKGFVWVRIDFEGVAAHGSRPQLGHDAIMDLGPVLTMLADLDDDLAARPHPLLGPASLHASVVAGGRDWSTIPGHARLDIERRTLPGESRTTVEDEVETILATATRRRPGLAATATVRLVRDPLATDVEHPFVGTTLAAAGHVRSRPMTPVGVSYWADSAMIAAAGIPTVLFGPDGDGAHAEVEWVSVEGTCVTRDVLVDVAQRLV
ncbi:MAG TPA: M20/M25/M40 family metallo-hydrolase [Nitriliruptoraceae bacterium]|nr:M20/M25/M40 family metallo-hydrolase [Nitriliruptoraceae bacterium]